MTIEFKKMVIELDQEGRQDLLFLIEEYIKSQGLRVKLKNCPHIYRFLEAMGFSYSTVHNIFEKCQSERTSGIEWLLGADGDPPIPLPKDYGYAPEQESG